MVKLLPLCMVDRGVAKITISVVLTGCARLKAKNDL